MKTLIIILLMIILFCQCSDISTELSGGYTYRYEGNDMIDINHYSNEKNICSIVIDYDFNDDFIIVAQKPNGNCVDGPDDKIYPMGYDTIYFWIILAKQHDLLGPFSETEFLYHRFKLGVPSNLKLDINRKP